MNDKLTLVGEKALRDLVKERDDLRSKISKLYLTWDDGGLLHGDNEHRQELIKRLGDIFEN